MNKIVSSSLLSHFSFCSGANLPLRKTLILSFLSYPGQAKMPDSSWITVKFIFTCFWEALPSIQLPLFRQYEGCIQSLKQAGFTSAPRKTFVQMALSLPSLFLQIIICCIDCYAMCLSWHQFWKGCCCAAVHSVSIHGVNDCCQSAGEELPLAWQQHAFHGQSGSGPTYWDVFLSVGHVNCSVAGTQTFMHAEQRASHLGKQSLRW